MNTERLGHYDIVEELGRGGMGVVYKGYESSLGRYVAIKVLAAAMAHDPIFVERFLREARSMAALNDPHIIQIYFIGQDEDQTFFVMEFIDGESLSDWIKRDTRLAPSDALKILLDASRGLASAHAQGVIHRDIKPGNIMITARGVVKVADFGIALASNDMSSKLTNTGALVGTPGYLSPEVCLGKPVDQRSDIFALGIVLFEMLSGRMPFIAESPLKLMLDVVEADIPDIRELNPDVDEETTRILSRMLAKNPAERYQTCNQLNADLAKHPLVVNGEPLKVRIWSEGDAAKATMVGTATPLTGGNRPPRLATPPPQVGARTQQPQVLVQATPAPATVQTQALPPAPRPSNKLVPMLLGGLLLLGLAGWAISRYLPSSANQAVAAPASPAVPLPAGALPPVPTPGQPDPAASTTANAVAAAGSTLADNASVAQAASATVEDAPVPVPAAEVAAMQNAASQASDPVAAEVLRREAARRRKLAAAAAARRANDSVAAPDDESVSSDSDDAGGGSRLSASEARRRYLCRVQKKC